MKGYWQDPIGAKGKYLQIVLHAWSQIVEDSGSSFNSLNA
jgi:hypothetical protein